MALSPARHPFVSQWLNGNMVMDNCENTTGFRFYVHSGTGTDATGYGYSPEAPVATLDYAIANLATASQGDIIICMPGHAENLAADSDVDMDKAGLTVLGLGSGSARPTFTCTVNTGDFKLAAAGSVIKNLLFLNDVDNSTGLLEISAADCKVLNCEFREDDAAKFADHLVITTVAADRLEVADCIFIGNAGDGAVALILFVGADNLHMHHCRFFGDCSSGCVEFDGTASLWVLLHDLNVINEDATGGADAIHGIKDTVTGCTGQIGPNIYVFLNANAANISAAVVGATFFCQRPIMVCNLANEAGMASDRTDSTDA